MLDAFVVQERSEIIVRAKRRVLGRTGPRPDLPDGIPDFLDQLVAALRRARSTATPDHAKIRESAHKQGVDLLRVGLTIEEVVHEYGDVCQTITELAIERKVAVPTPEFRIMNLCLDDAIAEAVTEFAGRRERSLKTAGTEAFGGIAHELRNLLATARSSFDIIRGGHVAPGGSTGRVLDRALTELDALVERSLEAGPTAN